MINELDFLESLTYIAYQNGYQFGWVYHMAIQCRMKTAYLHNVEQLKSLYKDFDKNNRYDFEFKTGFKDNSNKLSPYKILEIRDNAPSQEIKQAYKRLISLYHPDKVTHLGADLQELAHQKTLQLNKAYQDLMR